MDTALPDEYIDALASEYVDTLDLERGVRTGVLLFRIACVLDDDLSEREGRLKFEDEIIESLEADE